MKLKNKKQAYTLAEIMLVILVLTIILAAMAPIFTKRKLTQYTSKYNVWTYLERTNFDAYYDPGHPNPSGQLFFGITPNDSNSINSEFIPLSKIIVRAGIVTSDKKLQRHFQFRYGRNNSNKNGTFAGTWYVNRKNILLGGGYNNLEFNESNGARDNVAVGYNALTNLTNGQSNVAIGYNALSSIKSGKNNVAIGASAAKEITTDKNVFIGTRAGRNASGKQNVAIGYEAGVYVSNDQNLAVGANAGGNVPRPEIVDKKVFGSYNTSIGYKALGSLKNGKSNIAIGYKALGELKEGNYNIAIGYNACSELEKGSYKTCIGYNSGPKKRNSSLRIKDSHNAKNNGSAYLLWENAGTGNAINDEVERVYIGGTPRNYGGDAVLEIHNPDTMNVKLLESTYSSYAGNTTTVINGNLIVRGRPYFTVGNKLQHFHNSRSSMLDHNDKTNTSVLYYGYKENEQEYADCKASPASYVWGKCPNLNTSDRRLKNIEGRNYAGLKELSKLKVYNFTFKDDTNKLPQVGVMAQDLQKVFPNSVFKDKNGYLKIKWDEMFYAAINAIKELDKKIISLVKRATKVETQITQLEQENIELKSQIENLTARVNKLKAQ